MKLRTCNRLLAALALLILASGIQLEIISGNGSLWIWLHIIGGILFYWLMARHLHLHFGTRMHLYKNWCSKRKGNAWLAATGALTLLSGIIATIHWAIQPEHSKIGAVHGKTGFLFIGLAVWHMAQRRQFYFTKARF